MPRGEAISYVHSKKSKRDILGYVKYCDIYVLESSPTVLVDFVGDSCFVDIYIVLPSAGFEITPLIYNAWPICLANDEPWSNPWYTVLQTNTLTKTLNCIYLSR